MLFETFVSSGSRPFSQPTLRDIRPTSAVSAFEAKSRMLQSIRSNINAADRNTQTQKRIRIVESMQIVLVFDLDLEVLSTENQTNKLNIKAIYKNSSGNGKRIDLK